MNEITTIKITKETKKRLSNLDLSGKNKTFDVIVNELVTYYQKHQKGYKKDHQEWRKALDRSEKEWNEWRKNKGKSNNQIKEYRKLIIWAKSKGFKG